MTTDPEKAVPGPENSHQQEVGPAQVKREPGQSWKANEQHVLPKNRLGIVFAGLMCCIFLAALDQVWLGLAWRICYINRSQCEQTIVATALPTIVAKLGGGKDYSWVGRCANNALLTESGFAHNYIVQSAYLLSAASLATIYGKLSDLVGTRSLSYPIPSHSYFHAGRKPILYTCIVIFLVRDCISDTITCANPQLTQLGSALCGAAQTMVWLVVARAVQGIGGGGIIQMVQITVSDIVSLEE